MRAAQVITGFMFLFSTIHATSAQTPLDTAAIERLTGAKGQMSAKESVFKVTLPRADLRVTAAGVKLNPAMGLACWAAFKSVGDHTVVMGDLLEDQVNPVMSVAEPHRWRPTEQELQNVLKALRGHGISVVAIHNHMTDDNPRIMFLHYWGIGPAEQLARGLKAALDAQKGGLGA